MPALRPVPNLAVAITLLALATANLARATQIETDYVEEPRLNAGRKGSVVLLSNVWARLASLPAAPIRITPGRGPQFLFSDKPEYFRAGNGIALQEDVEPGIVRLYLYHVPDSGETPKVITALLENRGSHALKLRLLRQAFPEPGGDYLRIGKAGLVGLFSSKPEKQARTVPAGGRVPVDPKLDRTTVSGQQLVHGFYEFEIDQPARVTVLQRDPDQSSAEVVDRLPNLPRAEPGQASGAGRGQFAPSDLVVTNAPGTILDTASGVQWLVLADGKADPWVRGRDGLAGGEEVVNDGNYGVMYRARLAWRSTDGRGLALLITKQGGPSKYCPAQSGAVLVGAGQWPG